MTSIDTKFAAADVTLGTDSVPATALAQSALQMTRAAIARWRGNSRPAAAQPRDLARVSPQAHWVAEARYGLAQWIARGGFSQDEAGAPSLAESHRSDACID